MSISTTPKLSKALFYLITSSMVTSGLLCTQSLAAPGAKATPRKAVKSKTVTSAPSPANLPLVSVKDPVEGAFTALMPKGWRNQAYLFRVYQLYRTVMTSLSPDGNTLLFSGDPKMPNYAVPNGLMNPNTMPVAFLNPLMRFSNYVPAAEYFPNYVRTKFGKLPGFGLIKTTPDPDALRTMREAAAKRGLNVNVQTAMVHFVYQDGKKTMNAIARGYTMAFMDTWTVDVSGVTTTGDPNHFLPLLKRMTTKVDPQWNAREQQMRQQRFDQLRQDSQNNIAAINTSNQNHQMRMESIQDAGDASMQRWYQSNAQSDKTHRGFINYITGENTVVANNGKAFQVDNSHQKYFVNKHNNTYIGTDAHTNLEDLRRRGLNPNDYEPVKIRR